MRSEDSGISDMVASVKGTDAPKGERAYGWKFGVAYAIGLLVLFSPALLAWASAAWTHEHNSHVLLIPFISGYLIAINRNKLPRNYQSSPGAGALLLLIGLSGLVATWNHIIPRLDTSDIIAIRSAAFVTCVVAGGFFFLGGEWMRSQAFAVGFLFLMVPLPDRAANALEMASQHASAEAAAMFFSVSGLPYLREGNLFQIPGIMLQVAQECSGIRSSIVLFITGLLASNLFLQSTWRRLLLIGFVIPLGILRNGFRILVLGLLCVHIGPHMIDSVIHHWGGSLFFTLSLIPLLLFLLLLRKGDARPADGALSSASSEAKT